MFLGIDIGGTKCAVLKGVGKDIVYREAFATMDCQSTLNKIFSMIEKLDDDYEDLHGMGMEALMQMFDEWLTKEAR